MGPCEMLLKLTVTGALPDFTSTEIEAEGGTGVGAGIGVAVGVAAGAEVGVVAVAGGVGVDAGSSVGVGVGPPQAIARTAKTVIKVETTPSFFMSPPGCTGKQFANDEGVCLRLRLSSSISQGIRIHALIALIALPGWLKLL